MKINNETKIGILVVGVLVALGIVTVNTGDFHVAEKGYPLKAHFADVDGVELNAPVLLNGLEVGQVRAVKIVYGDETVMEVTLWIKESAKVREGARAYVKNMGLLGEKYIGLTSGSQGAGFLSPDSVVKGVEPGSLENIMADGEVIAANLKEVSESLNARFDDILANLQIASKNIASISQNVNERLTLNDEHIDEMVASLSSASQNLEELSYDLKINPWKLMYKPREKRDSALKAK